VHAVSVSAYGVSGIYGVDTEYITIYDNYPTQEFGVSLCGPAVFRFDGVRKIDLKKYLPDSFIGTDTEEVTGFFEGFLNSLYDGVYGFELSSTDINASATALTYNYPVDSLAVEQKISILEKIKRLSDMHDPDLIDIDYIQFFASNMGYNIDIKRNELGFGTFFEENSPCSASDVETYLRFMVTNLPNWNSIRTTDNMISTMLYSFGLVGDLVNLYTKNYSNNNEDWKQDNAGINRIPNSWYPTPHFSVVINVDESFNNIFFKIQEGEKIIRAITSVKPINSIFHSLAALTTESFTVKVTGVCRMSRYIRVESDGASDYWNL